MTLLEELRASRGRRTSTSRAPRSTTPGHPQERPGRRGQARAGDEMEPRAVSQDASIPRGTPWPSRTPISRSSSPVHAHQGGGLELRRDEPGTPARSLGQSGGGLTALLQKYTIRAPIDGIVLSIQAAVGSYVSMQGPYGTTPADSVRSS